MRENKSELLGEQNFERIQRFKDLFEYLHTHKMEGLYKQAYEESAELAKRMVDDKSKVGWNPDEFEEGMRGTYPMLPREFLSALRRCVEHYNPIINLPNRPLWDQD